MNLGTAVIEKCIQIDIYAPQTENKQLETVRERKQNKFEDYGIQVVYLNLSNIIKLQIISLLFSRDFLFPSSFFVHSGIMCEVRHGFAWSKAWVGNEHEYISHSDSPISCQRKVYKVCVQRVLTYGVDCWDLGIEDWEFEKFRENQDGCVMCHWTLCRSRQSSGNSFCCWCAEVGQADWDSLG